MWRQQFTHQQSIHTHSSHGNQIFIHENQVFRDTKFPYKYDVISLNKVTLLCGFKQETTSFIPVSPHIGDPDVS